MIHRSPSALCPTELLHSPDDVTRASVKASSSCALELLLARSNKAKNAGERCAKSKFIKRIHLFLQESQGTTNHVGSLKFLKFFFFFFFTICARLR